jgi:hypothetical protein
MSGVMNLSVDKKIAKNYQNIMDEQGLISGEAT